MSMKLDVIEYRPSVKVIGIGKKGYDVAKRIFLNGIKYVDVVGFDNDFNEEELKTVCERSDLLFVVYKHNDILNSTLYNNDISERPFTVDDVLPIFIDFKESTLIFGVIISDDDTVLIDQTKFFTHTLNVQKKDENDISLFIHSITDVTQVSFGLRELCIDFADLWQLSEISKEYVFYSVTRTGDDSIESASRKAIELLKEHNLTGSKCLYLNVTLGKELHCYSAIDQASSPIQKAMGNDCFVLLSEVEHLGDFPPNGVRISMTVSIH